MKQVYAQILNLNHDYKLNESAIISSRDLGATLEKRNKIEPPSCDPPGYGAASSTATLANYQYLNGLYGTRCIVGAGPRVCSRIACAKGGGVFLCNDVSPGLVYPRLTQTLIKLQNSYSISPDCGYLSTYVGDICTQCYGTCNALLNDYHVGQAFDTDNYDVLVDAQNC